MPNSPKTTYLRLALIGTLGLCCYPPVAAQNGPVATVRRLTVFPMSSNNDVELEIATTRPVVPQSQIITSPDRLVIDLPNAVPDDKLHNQQVSRGDLTAVRVGLFGNNPPVTRVVLDLKSPQRYEIVPDGNMIVVKVNLGGNRVAASLPVASTSVTGKPAVQATPGVTHQTPQTTASTPAIGKPAVQATPGVTHQTPAPSNRMDVEFRNGKLKILAERVTLAAVLNEVHRRTGTDIDIPPAAGQENIFVSLGPGSTREVLSALLNGSRFNFFMIGGESDPSAVRSVIVTPKDGEVASVPAISPPAAAPAQPTSVIMTPPETPPSLDSNPNPEAQDGPPPTDESAPAAEAGSDNDGDPDAGDSGSPDMVPHSRPNAGQPDQPGQPGQQPPQ